MDVKLLWSAKAHKIGSYLSSNTLKLSIQIHRSSCDWTVCVRTKKASCNWHTGTKTEPTVERVTSCTSNRHTHGFVFFLFVLTLRQWTLTPLTGLMSVATGTLPLGPRGSHKHFSNSLSTEQQRTSVAPWQRWQLNAEIQKAREYYLWTATSWLWVWTHPAEQCNLELIVFLLPLLTGRESGHRWELFADQETHTNLHCCHVSKDGVWYGICKQQHCECSCKKKKLFSKPCAVTSLLPHQKNKLLSLQFQLNSNTMTR